MLIQDATWELFCYSSSLSFPKTEATGATFGFFVAPPKMFCNNPSQEEIRGVFNSYYYHHEEDKFYPKHKDESTSNALISSRYGTCELPIMPIVLLLCTIGRADILLTGYLLNPRHTKRCTRYFIIIAHHVDGWHL